MILSIVAVAALIASSLSQSFLGSALFWTICGVLLALVVAIVGLIRLITNRSQTKSETGLSLYVNFVDDLQQELTRLHDQIIEERQDCIRKLRDKDIEIERLQVQIQGLQEELACEKDLRAKGL